MTNNSSRSSSSSRLTFDLMKEVSYQSSRASFRLEMQFPSDANQTTSQSYLKEELLEPTAPTNWTDSLLISSAEINNVTGDDYLGSANATYGLPTAVTEEGYTVDDGFDLADGWLRHGMGMTVVCCFAYFIVFALGLIGNGFVVIVVLRTPRMRTVTNFFIVNLAVADILVIVFCLPATLLSNIFVPWVLGWFMCKTVAYVQGLSVAASIYSLVALSFDRFLAICFPMRCQITRTRAKIVIIVMWVVALVIPVPWAMYFDLEMIEPDYPEFIICLEKWPSVEAAENYFVIGNLLLCYILPLIVISYCYIMIWIRVWSRSIPGETQGAHMDLMIQKSKVKVVKMLVVVVILFMLSWLPLYILFARLKLGGEVTPDDEYLLGIMTPLAQWLGSANSCINPILYAFFNNKFRTGFVAIMKTRKCCGTIGATYDDYSRSTIRKSEFHKSRSHWRREHVIDNDVSAGTFTSGL